VGAEPRTGHREARHLVEEVLYRDVDVDVLLVPVHPGALQERLSQEWCIVRKSMMSAQS
jgi:hypothetical protein